MKKGKFILYLLIGGLLLCFLVSAMGVKVPGSDQIKDGIDNIKDKVEDFIDDVIKPGDDEDDDRDKYIQTHWKFRDDITLSEVVAYVEDGNSVEIPLVYMTSELIGNIDSEGEVSEEFKGIRINLSNNVASTVSSCTFLGICVEESSPAHLLLSYNNSSASFVVNENYYNNDFTFCILEKPTAEAEKFLTSFCEPYSYIGSEWTFRESVANGLMRSFAHTFGECLDESNHRFVMSNGANIVWAEGTANLEGNLTFTLTCECSKLSDAMVLVKASKVGGNGEPEEIILIYGPGDEAIAGDIMGMNSYVDYIITLTEEPTADFLRFMNSFNNMVE